jgi:BolA family transcriptional regulator, general stress-responsive regulator
MRSQILKTKLEAAFSPDFLEVIDESHQHHGHSGAREGGETHYRIKIKTPAFAGLSRLAMHRAINAVLADDLKGGVHALAIEASAA